MSEEVDSYDALGVEDSWIDYLRRRLPYSFLKIRKERRQYILSEPKLHVGSVYHNFWRRGYAYYVAGKLTDIYDLARLWIDYRRLLSERIILRGGSPTATDSLYQAAHYYNSMQMEKLWVPVGENDLDRERVVMTNVCQAIELCLKAIKTHVEHRESGVFMFEDGHDLKIIYGSFPLSLRQVVENESAIFARQYAEFRKAVESAVNRLQETPRQEWDWEELGTMVVTKPYTAILRMNDPWTESEDWFGEAMECIRHIGYHRYSPDEGFDEYPVKSINCGLMLVRFLYEHLFPLPRTTKKSGSHRLMTTDLKW